MNLSYKIDLPILKTVNKNKIMPFLTIGAGFTPVSNNALKDFNFKLPMSIGLEYKLTNDFDLFYQSSAFLTNVYKFDGFEDSTDTNPDNDAYWIHEIDIKYNLKNRIKR